MNDIYLSNVKILETMSESTFQLALNGMVMKEFGVEDPIQVISGLFSMISIYKALAAQFCFIRNGDNKSMLSWDFAKALTDLAIPILALFTLILASWSEEYIEPPNQFAILFVLHPIVLGIPHFISNRCTVKSPIVPALY